MSNSNYNQITFGTNQNISSQKVAPGGQVVGVEHIQQLCDLSINNLKKNPEHEKMLRDGTIKIIGGDGRLGYPEAGKWRFPQR